MSLLEGEEESLKTIPRHDKGCFDFFVKEESCIGNSFFLF